MTAAHPDTTQAFLATIRANLADDAPRLIYADWLQENGQGAYATFIRSQIYRDGSGPLTFMPMMFKLPSACWDSWQRGGGRANRVSWTRGDDRLRFTIERGLISRVSAPLGVLCGERCERCEAHDVHGMRYQRDFNDRDKTVWNLCKSCHGTGRTPGVLRDIVRSEVAAVEYVDVSDLIIDRDHDGSYSCYRFVNRFGPIIDPKKLVLHRSEAASRAALSRAMLESV